MLSFTPEQIRAEAVRLGLITDGQELPQHQRSTAVASLASGPPAPPDDADAGGGDDEIGLPYGPELTVYTDGPVLLNGRPLAVADEPIEVTARHGGPTTVRLTLIVRAAHLLPGAPNDGAP